MHEYFLLFFNSDTHWTRGWDKLASMTRRKITFPAGDQNLIILGVASLFTD
jgi:hypothetical protein